jgi:alkaline phosphatase
MKTLSRRDFIRAGAASSFLFGATALPAQTRTSPTRPSRAKNLILVVSDGMSMGTLCMAEAFHRRQTGRSTHWFELYGRPGATRALMDTACASSLVTDSAAASTAWGSGVRVANGFINIAPDGSRLKPIFHRARAAGLATGLATTATITHATPAGFAAVVERRNDEADIAPQYLEHQVDVLLGGGAPFFSARNRRDGRDLFGDFASAGYQVLRDRRSLLKAGAPARMLGIFADSHLPYTLDHRASVDDSTIIPTLAEMTRAALATLSAGDRRFILQVEGARVDHAAHANDLGGLLHDQLALDAALGEVIAFCEQHPDTLLLVTSDHGNSNPGLNGTGGAYANTDRLFEKLAAFRQTNVWALSMLGKESTAETIRSVVHQATQLSLEDEEVALLQKALRAEHREGYRVRNAPLITLGQLLGNHTAVGWNGVSHTNDFTELVCWGPSSITVPNLMRNTDINTLMREALGIG